MLNISIVYLSPSDITSEFYMIECQPLDGISNKIQYFTLRMYSIQFTLVLTKKRYLVGPRMLK